MRTVLFLSVIAMTVVVSDLSFGQNRPFSRAQMAECDGPGGTGLPGGMGQRASGRGGMSDCPPPKEPAADSAGTQGDASTANLCGELASRKKLTGGDRDAFIKDCIGDSAAGVTGASTGADGEVLELCNQVADKRNLAGNARENFLADCASTGSAESTAEETGRSKGTPGRQIPGNLPGGRRLPH